ncbi:MAG: WecB/TagA/CpsF family glycosyltransferase [Cyanosarcina radialis HA8281-LM2]|jgi:N-acetylglucosaminyldiphosphoundecaprenol N-acetyl-beta-D-mannosaminyltransferase|nr:WecB/TagA/CpsF family glycosyltransferase [Cyanosarcina radialis HA8281-LM2]
MVDAYSLNRNVCLSKISPNDKIEVISTQVTALSFNAQIRMIYQWAIAGESRVVCVADAHMLIRAYRNLRHWNYKFGDVLRQADMVTPDGMPIVWMMRRLGRPRQERVAGMEIFRELCRRSQGHIKVFFVGSEDEILRKIEKRLKVDFPQLQIAGMRSLPMGEAALATNKELIKEINSSGASLVFVSLGCPKQEVWMHKHKDKIHAVTIGVGGVFPIYARILTRAPNWIQRMGLEWLYRLLQEPRRLWGRYRRTVPMFLLLALRQLIARKWKKIAATLDRKLYLR